MIASGSKICKNIVLKRVQVMTCTHSTTILARSHVGLHVTYRSLFSDLNQNRNVSTNLVKLRSIKSNQNRFSGSRVTRGQTDRQTDTPKLIDAFLQLLFINAPEKKHTWKKKNRRVKFWCENLALKGNLDLRVYKIIGYLTTLHQLQSSSVRE
jgi:hypothetical protein